MSTPLVRFDEELAENLHLASQVARCIVLAGRRQFDRFVLTDTGPNATPRVLGLERMVHTHLGLQATWAYDPARHRITLAHADELPDLETPLPLREGASEAMELIAALQHWSALPSGGYGPRYALLVDAGLLFQNPESIIEGEFELLRAMERHARQGNHECVLLLRCQRTSALPSTLLDSPQVRTVHIPAASRDVRQVYANLRGQLLAANCHVSVEEVSGALSSATEGWTLDQLDTLVRTAEHRKVDHVSDLEELARAVLIGTTHSPWAGSNIRTAVAGATDMLTRRVIGQPIAIQAVVTALQKAVVGLAAAHQGPGSQAPRAILFFAGPTGTGKTELAKAFSELVFGQEQLLRFDCGELQGENAVVRLIGAPPGYLGYDRGGELTEGIRAKPNSVVLFDEVEKAHPRLLDILLGVLDDGRLTSGQGETAYFGQSVLIFTSNLGMYEMVDSPEGGAVRRPRFDYDTPFKQIESEVRKAIGEAFVKGLGRPELLGRLGGKDAIIVFDYLRALEQVCRKFVDNIAKTYQRQHGAQLVVDDAIVQQVANATRMRPDALALGGRGLLKELDHWLSDPLAVFHFDRPQGNLLIRASLQNGRTVFITE